MPTPATVTGTLQTLTSGRIAQGKVIFQLTNIGTGNPVGVSGTSIIPALTYVAMTAQDGSFSISLWGNDVLTPTNTLYSVTFRDFQGNEIGPILYSITGGSANLNTLAATGTVAPPVIAANAIITNPTAAQTISGQQLNIADNVNGFFSGPSAILVMRNLNAGSNAGQAIVFGGDGFTSQAAIKVKTGSGAGDVGTLCLFAGGQGGEALDGQLFLSTTTLKLTVPIVLTAAAATVPAAQVSFGSTTAPTATAGAQTLPANPAGFLIINVAGTVQKIPYYNT